VREHQQQLAGLRHGLGIVLEQHGAQALGARRAARLARDDHLDAATAQPRAARVICVLLPAPSRLRT